MAKFEKKILARGLRKQGWSIKSISSHLGVSKSSASIWCRDLELTQEQRDALLKDAFEAGLKGRVLGAEKNRRKKQESIENYMRIGKLEFKNLDKRALSVAGLALYWAEGSKTTNRLSFSNSDPSMILFVIMWFREVFGIKNEDLMPRIYINEVHRGRITTVLNFWSSLVNLPPEQFGKPTFIRTKLEKVYENHDQYFGTLTLRVRRSSDLKYNIMGKIGALRDYASGQDSSVGRAHHS